MRTRFWGKKNTGVTLEGPPWVEHFSNEENEGIKLSLSGTDNQVIVVFLKEEWQSIKNRGDAAFEGKDANRGFFWAGKASEQPS